LDTMRWYWVCPVCPFYENNIAKQSRTIDSRCFPVVKDPDEIPTGSHPKEASNIGYRKNLQLSTNLGPGFIIPSIYGYRHIRTGCVEIGPWKTRHKICVDMRTFFTVYTYTEPVAYSPLRVDTNGITLELQRYSADAVYRRIQNSKDRSMGDGRA